MVNLYLSLFDLHAPLPTPQNSRFNGFFIREEKEIIIVLKIGTKTLNTYSNIGIPTSYIKNKYFISKLNIKFNK